MHYVVDEYKSSIFPNANENHSFAHKQTLHNQNKTMYNASRTFRTNDN